MSQQGVLRSKIAELQAELDANVAETQGIEKINAQIRDEMLKIANPLPITK